VFQKILYRYYHIRESALGHRIFADFRTAVDSVLPVCAADVFRAHDLAEQYPQVPPRDLLHAAVMKNNGLAQILSADRDFDAIEGIERLDPIDWLEASIAAQKDEDDV
jgi:predicted nucleic acid-binding protein